MKHNFGLRGATAKLTTFAGLFISMLMLVIACTNPLEPSSDSQSASLDPATQNSQVPEQVSLGMNLNGVTDWSTEVPFLDLFKMARDWIPQCKADEVGCTGSWDTQEYDKLDLDEHGWVKSLPAPEDPPEYTRVGTVIFPGVEQYLGGKYVVLYDGEGTIEYQFGIQKDGAASRLGRDVISVPGSGDGIFITITATDPNRNGNYLRNIRIIPIEYENSYQTETFNPIFIERIKKFSTVRFMDWMQTNNSEQTNWSDRPQIEDATYSTDKGVPLELMIELANQLRVSPWFNIPIKATDDYITNFARLVKEKLDPDLKVYVELSNEVWNWQFQQAQYALQQGKARWGEDKGDAFMQWYGMRAAQMSDIWNQVFDDQRDRLISVISTQTGWQGLETSVLDCSYWAAEGNKPCYQHDFDVYAITGYFSGNLGAPEHTAEVESWLREPDGGFSKAMDRLMASKDNWGDTIEDNYNSFQYQAKVAKSKGLRLVAYEGGQHINGRQGVENNEKLTQFFIELNRQRQMYELYTALLEKWEAAGGTLFMHFVDASAPSKWGSWGALEYIEQESSPKYDALIDFIDRTAQP